MNRVLPVMRWLDKAFLAALKAITIICFFLLTILISANVLVRFFPVMSLHWFDEIIEMLYAYLVFYGAAALWISREHFSVGDWIGAKIIKNARARHFYRMILEVLVLIFVVIFFYYSFRLTGLALDVTNVFAIPKKVLYSCLPIAGAIMLVYSLRNIVSEALAMIREPENGIPL